MLGIILKFKKLHELAEIPTYAKPGDAGLDLKTIADPVWDAEGRFFEYDTGLAVEIPEGYVGLLFPRSSVSSKDLRLCNSVGVIDSGYRGPIKLRFKTDAVHENLSLKYRQFDKVGQLIVLPYPTIVTMEVNELSDTKRGAGGFGSSGR